MSDSQISVVYLPAEKQRAAARQYHCVRSSDTGVLVRQLAAAAAAVELQVKTSILQQSRNVLESPLVLHREFLGPVLKLNSFTWLNLAYYKISHNMIC